MNYAPRKLLKNRRAVVLVCVLACATVAISLVTSGVQLSLTGLRESRQLIRVRQAQWIMQAAVIRVRQKLRDPKYVGEIWELPKRVVEAGASRVVIELPSLSTEDSEAEVVEEIQVQIRVELGTDGPEDQILRRSMALVLQNPSSRLNPKAETDSLKKPDLE